MKRKALQTRRKGGKKGKNGERSALELKNNQVYPDIQKCKPTTHKGRKIMESQEPQVHEPPKQSVFLRGSSCSQQVKQLITELHMVRKPFSVQLSRKQVGLDPFRDCEPLEYLSNENHCGLFCYGSSSKQRPFRLVMGRMFEKTLLDMYEVHISDYKPLALFRNIRQPIFGSKPLAIAQGSEFESSEELKAFRNYLLDFFSVGKANKVLLNGVDQLITLTAIPPAPLVQGVSLPVTTPQNYLASRILFRRFRIDQSRVPGKASPELVLEECGPRFTMSLDRNRLPQSDIWKLAIKLPREIKPTKIKNVSTNVLGEKIGRVHVGVQDFKGLHTPHHHGVIAKKTHDRDDVPME